MRIRPSTYADLDRMMEICDIARDFMQKSGNPHQWAGSYPDRDLLAADIAAGHSYVVMDEDDTPHATFMFRIGEDPTYATIYKGEWLNNQPYGTIHRVASDGTTNGIFERVMEYCSSLCTNLRIDTHPDNAPMLHLIDRLGFQRCGLIIVEDWTPRHAFQKITSYL